MLPPLATPEDFTALTGVAVTSDNDATITALLLRASIAVRTATGQTISRVEGDVVTLDPTSAKLLLPQRPADLPTSITSGGVAVTGWQLRGQQLVGVPGVPYLPSPLVVTYSHGYAAGQVPDEIVALVVDLANRRRQNPEEVTSYRTGDYSATLPGLALSDTERDAARRALGLPLAASMALGS